MSKLITINPGKNIFKIVPDDGTEVSPKPRHLLFMEDGDVAIEGEDGNSEVVPVTTGTQISFSPSKILATDTTITEIFGLL